MLPNISLEFFESTFDPISYKAQSTNLDPDQYDMNHNYKPICCNVRVFFGLGMYLPTVLFTLIGESMSVGYIDTSAGLQGRRSR